MKTPPSFHLRNVFIQGLLVIGGVFIFLQIVSTINGTVEHASRGDNDILGLVQMNFGDLGVSSGQDDIDPQASKGILTGLITDIYDQPLSNTDIEISEINNGSFTFTTTNAKGIYSVALNPGTYEIDIVNYNNYFKKRESNIIIEAGLTTTVNGQLDKMPLVHGRILDRNGKPVENAEAYLLFWRPPTGSRDGRWEGSTTSEPTTADGEYTIAAFPGTYRIGFHKLGDYSTYVDTYFPQKSSVDEAQDFELVPNMVVTDINGAHYNGFISGYITNSEGKPVQTNIEIYDQLDGRNLYPYAGGDSDENGYFKFIIRKTGIFYVRVPGAFTAESYAYEYYDNQRELLKSDGIYVEPNDAIVLNIQLDPLPAVQGKVTDMDGNTIAGATLHFYSGPWVDRTITTDAEGNYTMRGLPPTVDYTIRIYHSNYQTQFFSNYYDAGDSYYPDPNRSNLIISPGMPDLQLNFRLLNDDDKLNEFRTLSGTIVNQDQELLPHIMVRAYRQEGDSWQEVGSDQSDQQGRFEILVDDFGPYRLGFQDIDFRQLPTKYGQSYYPYRPSIDEAEDIIVDEMGTEKVVMLYNIPDILGRVTDVKGIGIPNTVVMAYQWVEAEGQGRWQCCTARTMTDAGGDYSMFDLPPGVYRLRVKATWLGYENEFYPDANDLEQAQDITVGFGNSAYLPDMTLTANTLEVQEILLPIVYR